MFNLRRITNSYVLFLYNNEIINDCIFYVGASGCTGVFSCDHICIPLPQNRFVCACADGYEESGFKCIKTGRVN